MAFDQHGIWLAWHLADMAFGRHGIWPTDIWPTQCLAYAAITPFDRQLIGRQVSFHVVCVDQMSVGQLVFDEKTRNPPIALVRLRISHHKKLDFEGFIDLIFLKLSVPPNERVKMNLGSFKSLKGRPSFKRQQQQQQQEQQEGLNVIKLSSQ
jgi:hypothetical protein